MAHKEIDLAQFHLDDVADLLGASHLNRVARYWADDRTITTKADSLHELKAVLSSPAKVRAVIDRLGDTERQILGEVKRQGGVADGWALYVFAGLRGLPLPAIKRTTSAPSLFNGESPARFKDAEYLWVPMANGLLFPTGMPNPWIRGHYFFSWSSETPLDNLPPHLALVMADERLLAQLPEPSPPPLKLAVAAASAISTPSFGVSGILTLLRMNELARVLRLQGSLPLTQSGSYNKSALGRLSKASAVLDNAETELALAAELGLLERRKDQAGKDEMALHPTGLSELLDAGPARLLRQLQRGALGRAPEDGKYEMQAPNGLRACLLALLYELPHPTPLAEVVRLLGEVTPKELRQSGNIYNRTPDLDAWKTWTVAMLRGHFSNLGLVQVVGDVVYPNPLLSGAELPPAPSGPAWIVQPNFELMVYPAQLTPAQIRTLGAAEAVKLDAQVCTYRLTRESVYAALEAGQTLDDLLTDLEAGSATPLTPSLRRSLSDWAARRDRLVLFQGVTVLEFASRERRDAALQKDGGTAVGDTLLMLEAGKKPAPGTSLIKYGEAPKKVLKFAPDGAFRLDGPLDLQVRSALAGHLAQEKRGEDVVYRLLPPPAGQTLAASLLPDLQARATGPLPDLLKTQLAVWTGRDPAPALAPVTVFQHPQAVALAGLPAFAGLLDRALGPGLYAVQPGKEAELGRLLAGLGLAPSAQISAPAQVSDELLTIADTRKKREYLEEALRGGQTVTIHYHEEKRTGGWYGGTVAQGKLRKGDYLPLSIDRSGNTPYLSAKNLETDTTAEIRIAYIVAMRAR